METLLVVPDGLLELCAVVAIAVLGIWLALVFGWAVVEVIFHMISMLRKDRHSHD